jgi:hypothetical protein
MKKLSVLGAILSGCFFFSAFINLFSNEEPVPIPASKQRLGGDATKGYEYLVSGDYVRSGIPLSVFVAGGGKKDKVYINRSGLNEGIPHEYTVIKAGNGELLVAPNCLQCHAQVFEGEFILGLGNSLVDFNDNKKLNVENLKMLENVLKNNFPSRYEAAAPFLTVTQTVSPYLKVQARGVNPADRLAAVLAAHRDPVTFKWIEKAQLEIPSEIIPTDTPPWWLLKKKNAMFYNGFGRGDFGRFLMASNLLTVIDTSESADVDRHMPDVLAYLYSLEPPEYKQPIDRQLAGEGKTLFQENCSKCHGTYGDNETYPNLLIPQSIIQTDSFLHRANYSNSQFVKWFNNSWFTTGEHAAQLQPFHGYIAPPLDGIWISAPYLHNGSVPTLEALLNSEVRPRYWSRDFQNPQYDYQNVGWKFSVLEKPGVPGIYNTDLNGYGNYGHYFGDVLSDSERKAVIEYLKTL